MVTVRREILHLEVDLVWPGKGWRKGLMLTERFEEKVEGEVERKVEAEAQDG